MKKSGSRVYLTVDEMYPDLLTHPSFEGKDRRCGAETRRSCFVRIYRDELA